MLLVPGRVQNLKCSGVDQTTLSLTWREPRAQANEEVGYIIDVKRLQHRGSTRELESVALLGQSHDKEVEGLLTTIFGLGKLHQYNKGTPALCFLL